MTKVSTAGEKRRPATVTRHTSRDDFRLGDGPHLKAGDDGAVFGDEADAQAAGDHVLDPVLALARIGIERRDAALVAELRQVVPILAIEAPEVDLAVDRGDRDRIVFAPAGGPPGTPA